MGRCSCFFMSILCGPCCTPAWLFFIIANPAAQKVIILSAAVFSSDRLHRNVSKVKILVCFPKGLFHVALREKLWLEACPPVKKLLHSAVVFGSCWAADLAFWVCLMPFPRAVAPGKACSGPRKGLRPSSWDSSIWKAIAGCSYQGWKIRISEVNSLLSQDGSELQPIKWRHCTDWISCSKMPWKSSSKYVLQFFHTSFC